MAPTRLDREVRRWADPIWWAGQQLEVMIATATYLTRVAQACIRIATCDAATVVLPTVDFPGADLPVLGWDGLSLASIRARLSGLTEADLALLHTHEERHCARADVLSMLANRLNKIQAASHPGSELGS